ncbi:I78 family peptidase inhibitor [Yoonia sp. SS1-5]|uniref:I78 family peptidase inhibitor n=1 Tax=Yoonia rhodophyticola TaxID=3137370 RepID=A0AAN0MBQ6_9RHOB
MRRILILLMLAACAPATEIPGSAPELPDTCGAARFAELIGQDATALERVLIMRMVRVIRPGDAVTQDFRPERINFQIGPDEKVSDITCG